MTISRLSIQEIIDILKKTPEQMVFDWKKDFTFSKDDSEKGELVKDISAIANGAINSDGYLFYGVNPNAPDPIVGIKSTDIDDATLQQFVSGKVDPPIEFLKYELLHNGKKVVVIYIPRSMKRPHIIACDIGKLKQGQILIRSGSSTRGILRTDLIECFYSLDKSPYFRAVLYKYQMDVNALKVINDSIRLLQDDEDRIDRDINRTLGF